MVSSMRCATANATSSCHDLHPDLLDSSSSKEPTHVHLGRSPLRRELRNAEETLAEFDEAIGSVHGVDPKSSQTRPHLAIESPPNEPVWSHSIPSTTIW